jgi:hypothetical protein
MKIYECTIKTVEEEILCDQKVVVMETPLEEQRYYDSDDGNALLKGTGLTDDDIYYYADMEEWNAKMLSGEEKILSADTYGTICNAV